MLRIGDYGTRVNQGVAGALSRRATVHRTVALNGFESRSPAKEKPKAQSHKCVGGVMTPPYDGMLYKSKFEALTVEHNQDAFINHRGW